jgi:hypothetical protein
MAPGTEATPPEATIVEGMYILTTRFASGSSRSPSIDVVCLVMTETQVEGTTIPEVVPVEGTAPEATALEGATTEPEVPVAHVPTEEVHDDALSETSMDVVVRSPEIQDTEPICSAPMSEAAPTSHGRLELLSDDLIDPAMVAQNLELMRRTEQWMKVRDSTLE